MSDPRSTVSRSTVSRSTDSRSTGQKLHRRGAAENPHNRFERIAVEADPDYQDPDGDEPPAPKTRFYRDPSRQILAHNDSPDVGFDTSLNPYRGCEHGCIYCFARPTHEYLGLSAGLDFETHILVKEKAPELLRKAFSNPRWEPRQVGLGAVTDPYQPIEGRMRITRRCLEVFAEFRNPVGIVTKGGLVARDADLLADLAAVNAACVNVSVTSLDRDLARVLEPRAGTPRRRLEAIEALSRAGVPVGVMVAPVIPGLNDHEIPAIVEACARAGAGFASHLVLRLPYGVKDLFVEWLERHFPERKEKVLGRIRGMRGGRLSDGRFHSRHRAEGLYAQQLHSLFSLTCRRAGLPEKGPTLSTESFRRPGDAQLSLFSGD